MWDDVSEARLLGLVQKIDAFRDIGSPYMDKDIGAVNAEIRVMQDRLGKRHITGECHMTIPFIQVQLNGTIQNFDEWKAMLDEHSN